MLPILKRSDIVVGLVLLAFGGVATWAALDIPAGPAMRTLPPKTFPLICTLGIGLCGVALLVKGLAGDGGGAIRMPLDSRQALVLALFLAFFLSFEHVDYRVSTIVFVAAVMAVLGCRSVLQLILVPLSTAAGIWLFFQVFFDVFLPTWI